MRTKKFKKSKKNRNKYNKTINKKYVNVKGGTNSNEECSMCCKKLSKNESVLIPNECLMKYGKFRAHKICSDCWWSKFAQEGVSHKCPGCKNNKPLNNNINNNKITNNNEIIDLTED